MNAPLVSECPHCSAPKAVFTLIGQHKIAHSHHWNVLFQCCVCSMPLATRITILSGRTPKDIADITTAPDVAAMRIFPEIEPITAPEYVPAPIAAEFIEAQFCMRSEKSNAAGVMYRRVLELVMREQAPDKNHATLYERIEHLANTGKLTPDMRAWAHELRNLGNIAVHDVDAFDMEEVIQIAQLTRYILIYLYTLPGQIAWIRQSRRSAEK